MSAITGVEFTISIKVIIVSTIDKVGSLECLRIDSGDCEVDKTIEGNLNVIIDYNEEIMMEVVC